jgi:hypothetical protein
VKFWVALAFLSLAVGIPSLLGLIWTVISISRHHYLTSAVALGFAIFGFGLLVPIVLAKTGRAEVRGDYGADGTLVRPDRKIDAISQVTAFAQVLTMSLYVIFAPLGRVDIPVPQGMRPYFLFICGAGALWGLPSLWAMLRHGGISYLRLSGKGFEIRQGLTSRCGTWSEVGGVAAGAPGRPWPMRGTLFLLGSEGRSSPSLVVDSFTPGGHALREWVRFYWSHPEHRAELTDFRALERLRSLT